MLSCLEHIHASQSGALLTLLLEKFLHTHHLTVARQCDMLACRRVELMLAEDVQVNRVRNDLVARLRVASLWFWYALGFFLVGKLCALYFSADLYEAQ